MIDALGVLEAITPSRIGGAEVLVTEICRMLPDLGARTALFCPAGRPFVDYAARLGIDCASWKTHGKLDPVTVVRLARLLRKTDSRVIHTHLSTASLLGAFAAKLARRRSVAHVHGLNTATCFRYSDAVIAVSHAVKEHLTSQGLPDEKVRVVHNGVNSRAFRPVDIAEAKTKLGYDERAPVFGVFGRLSGEKGQRVAIEAMFLLLKEHPNARLVLAGDGPDMSDLRKSADALEIGGSIIFAGFVEDVKGLMSACDAVVVPSLKEGFGLSAVEAMALERPVVASAVGGLKEIVLEGETGFLVPPNDPLAVADSLGKLIEDGPLGERLGRAGRERVREHFELEKQVGAVLSVLREVA